MVFCHVLLTLTLTLTLMLTLWMCTLFTKNERHNERQCATCRMKCRNPRIVFTRIRSPRTKSTSTRICSHFLYIVLWGMTKYRKGPQGSIIKNRKGSAMARNRFRSSRCVRFCDLRTTQNNGSYKQRKELILMQRKVQKRCTFLSLSVVHGFYNTMCNSKRCPMVTKGTWVQMDHLFCFFSIFHMILVREDKGPVGQTIGLCCSLFIIIIIIFFSRLGRRLVDWSWNCMFTVWCQTSRRCNVRLKQFTDGADITDSSRKFQKLTIL